MRRRIQRLEIFYFYIGKLRRKCNIDVPAQLHLLKIRMIFNQRQLSAKALRVRNDIFHRLQLGHVEPCFGWHVEVDVADAQTCFLVTGNGPADASFAPVVSRKGEVPVAEHAVKFLQIVKCCAGRSQHVAAVIAKNVLLERKVFSGCWHELPHARCLGA